jgi:hypothetical protein
MALRSKPSWPTRRRGRGGHLVLALGVIVATAGCVGSTTIAEPAGSPAVAILLPSTLEPAPTYHPTLGRPAAPPRPDLPSEQLVAGAAPFVENLFRRGDFVSQARADWCVPASIRMMMNMIDEAGDRSRPTQASLDRLARSLSSDRLQGAGSEPEGWAGALDRLGYGPYEVRAERTRAAALRMAARAIRLTGRPVGLLMWRGAHAWVVSGFRATADPAVTGDFAVTDLYVEDPWYPRSSSMMGRSRPPDTRVSVDRLVTTYLPWRRAVRYVEKDGRFVLVVPVVKVDPVPTGP